MGKSHRLFARTRIHHGVDYKMHSAVPNGCWDGTVVENLIGWKSRPQDRKGQAKREQFDEHHPKLYRITEASKLPLPDITVAQVFLVANRAICSTQLSGRSVDSRPTVIVSRVLLVLRRRATLSDWRLNRVCGKELEGVPVASRARCLPGSTSSTQVPRPNHTLVD